MGLELFNMVMIVFFFAELPWDEPTYGCQEYCDWKDCKITLTPWSKIDNMVLCKLNN